MFKRPAGHTYRELRADLGPAGLDSAPQPVVEGMRSRLGTVARHSIPLLADPCRILDRNFLIPLKLD